MILNRAKNRWKNLVVNVFCQEAFIIKSRNPRRKHGIMVLSEAFVKEIGFFVSFLYFSVVCGGLVRFSATFD